MKSLNLFWILGAAAVAGAGYYFYQKSAAPAAATPASGATSTPAATTPSANQWTASYTGQVINMKVGDSLVASNETTGPTVGGSSLFGGTESAIINTGAGATAVIAGTETLTWPDMTVTVNVS
jgi:hypothetical protein